MMNWDNVLQVTKDPKFQLKEMSLLFDVSGKGSLIHLPTVSHYWPRDMATTVRMAAAFGSDFFQVAVAR